MRGDLFWIATLLASCTAKLLYGPLAFSKLFLVTENNKPQRAYDTIGSD